MNQIRSGSTLTISGSATSQALTNVEDGSFFFRTVASDSAQAIVLAQRIASEGREHLCLVYRDDVYGSGLAEALRLRMQPTAIDIVESRYDPTGSSLVRVMDACESIREQPNSGVVFITFQADGRLIMDDAAARGWNTTTHRIFLVDGNRRIQLFEALANRAAFSGAIGTASASPEPETAAGGRLIAFRQRFMQRYGRMVGGFGANHYDTVYLAALSIELAGTADDRTAVRDGIYHSSAGRQELCNDWPGIRAAIAADAQVDYLGASGDVDLDLTRGITGGDLLPPFYIQIWAFDGNQIVEREVVTVPRT
jgi:branched-chain amino acid transport system substrate-binding protein